MVKGLTKLFAYVVGLFILLCLPSSLFAGWSDPKLISYAGVFFEPLIKGQNDTLHVVADNEVYDDYIWYWRSIDGGETWSEAFKLIDSTVTHNCFFPSLLMSDQNIFVVWANDDEQGLYQENICLSKSIDSGESWILGRKILPQDGYMLGQHHIGISENYLYVVYTDFEQEDKSFRIIRSNDLGESWEEPTEIFYGGEDGGIKTVAVGNTIHVLWSGNIDGDSDWQIYYLRSTDEGLTWSGNINLRQSETSAGLFPRIISVEDTLLIASWMDYRYSPYWITGDIILRFSLDEGDTWSDEIQATSNHEVREFDVVVYDSTIYLAWEDYRNSSREIYFQNSTDMGLTWEPEERVTINTFDSRDPSLSASGDNLCLVFGNNYWEPDSSEYSGVYFSKYDENVSIDEHADLLPSHETLISAYPNPFNSSTTISYTIQQTTNVRPEIYDILGRKIETLLDQIQPAGRHSVVWQANGISSGIYFCKLKADEKTETTRLVLVK